MAVNSNAKQVVFVGFALLSLNSSTHGLTMREKDGVCLEKKQGV